MNEERREEGELLSYNEVRKLFEKVDEWGPSEDSGGEYEGRIGNSGIGVQIKRPWRDVNTIRLRAFDKESGCNLGEFSFESQEMLDLFEVVLGIAIPQDEYSEKQIVSGLKRARAVISGDTRLDYEGRLREIHSKLVEHRKIRSEENKRNSHPSLVSEITRAYNCGVNDGCVNTATWVEKEIEKNFSEIDFERAERGNGNG